jgi:hypothetical protein
MAPLPRRARVAHVARAALATSLLLAGCGGKGAEAPKGAAAPLAVPSLPAVTQGPGARWAIVAQPKALFEGPLGAPLSLVLPREGLDRLGITLGFDVRKSPDALVAGYAEASFYAARLPAGTSPQLALDAFQRRAMQPSGTASNRPDVVRAWGTLPSGTRGSAAGLWAPGGDVIIGEGGRFGPVNVSIALASGQLKKERGLAEQAPFASLLAWSAGAPLRVLARCPLSEQVPKPEGGEAPALTEECDGAALSARPLEGGKLELRAHVEGRWGKDAQLIEKEARAVVGRVTAGEIGRALGLVDAPFEYASSERAIDVRVVVDAAPFAERLRKLISADLPEVMR